MTTASSPDAVDASATEPRGEALALFDAYGGSLYRFCRFTLGRVDEAEDVVQESFLKLLQHLANGGDRTNLRAWLFAVAANACRDRTRWRVRWVPWRADTDVRVTSPPDDPIDRQRAHAALRTLPRRDRLLLSLRAQGLSYREIAQAAAISEASVGRLVARAVTRWKKSVHAQTKR